MTGGYVLKATAKIAMLKRHTPWKHLGGRP